MNPIKSKPSNSKPNTKEVIKGIFRTFELLLGIFFVIIGAELFLFVHEETVFGVVFFLIGIGFLLSFYTTRKRRELEPINNYELSKQKGGDKSKR